MASVFMLFILHKFGIYATIEVEVIMFKKRGIIICGFAGIGKSSIREAVPYYKDIKLYDLQSHAFVKDYGWQRNYVECAIALAEKYDFVFLSTHDVVIDELQRRGEKFYIIYPSRYLKDEYMERFKMRGSSLDYITRFRAQWDNFINKLDDLKCDNKITLRSGQYLSDVILRLR